MTTDNATPPMATAVAPNSHFQLRPWEKKTTQESVLKSMNCVVIQWKGAHKIYNQGLKLMNYRDSLYKNTQRFTQRLLHSISPHLMMMGWDLNVTLCLFVFPKEGLSHPWRLGPVFLCAATSRVTQHLFIHGLLCPSLLWVLLHQLGEFSMDCL